MRPDERISYARGVPQKPDQTRETWTRAGTENEQMEELYHGERVSWPWIDRGFAAVTFKTREGEVTTPRPVLQPREVTHKT